jgi:hypothetical protein
MWRDWGDARIGIASSQQRLAAGWVVRGSNPGVWKKCSLLHVRLYRPWGPSNLLYGGYRASFPGVKRRGRGVGHSPSPSAEVENGLIYTSAFPLCRHWHVTGWPLPLLRKIRIKPEDSLCPSRYSNLPPPEYTSEFNFFRSIFYN